MRGACCRAVVGVWWIPKLVLGGSFEHMDGALICFSEQRHSGVQQFSTACAVSIITALAFVSTLFNAISKNL